MIKTHKRFKYGIGAAVFVLSVFTLQFSQIAPVSAATLTFTGGGSSANFSDGANWSGGVAPTDGDEIVLSTGPSTGMSVVNDIVGLDLAGISSTGLNGNPITISGNDLTISGNITHANSGTLTLSTNLALGADVVMSGNIAFAGNDKRIDVKTHNLSLMQSTSCRTIYGLSGSGTISINTVQGSHGYRVVNNASASAGFTGSISVERGTLAVGPHALGNVSSINVENEGVLVFNTVSNRTLPAAVSLSGSGSIAAQREDTCAVAPYDKNSGAFETSTTTLSGQVTLESNFEYSGVHNLAITGPYIQNGHTFTMRKGAGDVTTPAGVLSAESFTTEATGTTSDEVYVINKETLTLSGSRESVLVTRGGYLKGTGSANAIVVAGRVNPGNSPGLLTARTVFGVIGGGTHEVEIVDKHSFDKVVAGQDYVSGANPQYPSAVVFNNGAKLNPILYDGWNITAGDQFMIIDNRGSDPVYGTYDTLVEGAQLTVDGITFSITYVGGDGNDVVLTALNTGSDPTPPNTGAAELIRANPVTTAVLGLVAAAALIFIAVRRRATK